MADDLLILISSPPNNPKALSALRLTRALREGGSRSVSLCLLQDAVLLALASQPMERIPALASEIEVYALGEDLRMRGFDEEEVISNVHLIDYERLVDLMVDRRTMGAF